mmetsp:Transcript_89656/g.208846  ORF Transcript_89656/g.208846 Transcript_89656/m.208846 type:complete len:221 (+) Transcript_89656:128-790(+)|eukprot:CAMPEP_0171093882 /NCGR_PEP_ID=MMETSP0766_2-20121228/39332_1 /TAXON_ID=439317 /ORGANISM="Gambierdiscus australes, Strain CAWD 149" /LENGTH=220 /DNA_ID=CAMNT_0011552387 /DNA_START=127 /DNA_END=789 /DNA_ORIENTATION=-
MAGDADDALRSAGFVPSGEVLSDEAGDEDGSRGPPLCAALAVHGGGHQASLFHLGSRAPPLIKLWTSDGDTGDGVGFVCAHCVATKGIFLAQMIVMGAAASSSDEAQATQRAVAEQSMKGAITTLLDVAESCHARKITLGLNQAHASCAELVCSLLYLGFEVAPSRKSPLVGAALQLDLDIGWPCPSLPSSSDQTCTGTSDCSTSAEDAGALDNGGTDSE